MHKKREVTVWMITRKAQGGLVVLKLMDGDLVIPFFASLDEVQSIVKGYDAPVLKRLSMHDLVLELVHQMGLVLLQVEVYAIKNNIFYTKLFFSGIVSDPEKEGTGNTILSVHSRPADAVALAVRSKCPLYVSQGVLEQVGVPVACFTDGIERLEGDWLDMLPLSREQDYTGPGVPYWRSLEPEVTLAREV
ncbi:MAG: bifunctional nuclease family protein [Treponema sp.]|jgi:bifunctional DNase/RNase|nr:bifunctional nuclease family protein [Treponema sp.]